MRRRIFLKAIEHFQGELVQALVLKDIEPDIATDIVQNMVARTLALKTYLKIAHETIDTKMKGYLMHTTKWEMLDEFRRHTARNSAVGQMLETEDDVEDTGHTRATIMEDPTEEDIIACPFCHVGVLNEFGACALCHTILGKNSVPRTQLSLQDMLDVTTPDLGMLVDVRAAMSTLDHLEQRLVNAEVYGNSTLEDMAELTRIPRTQLWRILTNAKIKLQTALFEYGPAQ